MIESLRGRATHPSRRLEEDQPMLSPADQTKQSESRSAIVKPRTSFPEKIVAIILAIGRSRAQGALSSLQVQTESPWE